ncbi:MAG TPA: alkaline phosphatase D family protein, partial [Solirubrobacteraceae bacterium]|nr:alkaline phosphatase D family protein [Solirubrobacteraceae bacterium]
MAQLILGPLLRFVDEHSATVWVETDGPCEVEVLGRRASTFHVSGHHYALVEIDGLEPEGVEYAVSLDGEPRWPLADSGMPPSRITPLTPGRELRIAFGSCRVAAPHDGPWALEPHEHERGHGVDALVALALRMRTQDPSDWPSLLLMVGDQVYADNASPETRAFIRRRRPTDRPPGEQVADFEEYTRLYQESWSDPVIRWLFSTLPSAMIFDDHEVIDDWNISRSWKQEMLRTPWWADRIAGALSSYWIYQHLGNLSPAELRDDPLYAQVRAADDAEPLLREFALHSDRTTDGTRWSYSRRLNGSRLVVIDSRAGRLLTGDVDHLLIVTSLPYLLPRPIHDLEAWDEAVCDGVWGRRAARLGERLRRAVDLEHWAAFRSSFDRLAVTLGAVAAGERGRPPETIVLLSGDVHYAYLAQAGFRDRPVTSRIYQAVCSPFRHGLGAMLERANRL